MEFVRNALTYAGFRSGHLGIVKALLACVGWFIALGFVVVVLENAGLIGTGTKRVMPLVFFGGCFVIWREVVKRGKPGLEVFEAGLKEEARRENEKIDQFRTNEEWELRQLQKRIAELESSIATLRASEQRLGIFEPLRSGKLQCPRCWVKRGVQQDLATNGSEAFDRARCPAQGCAFRFNAP